jgi:hypothetical protein
VIKEFTCSAMQHPLIDVKYVSMLVRKDPHATTQNSPIINKKGNHEKEIFT